MKRYLSSLVFVLLIAGMAAAVDVRLNDGSVISAESYTLNGSYLMLKLADGRQVAYDVAVVDLEALRAAEAAANAAAGAKAEIPSETDPDEALSSGRQLQDMAAAGVSTGGSGLTISDRDVKHVRGSGVLGDGEEEDEEEDNAGGVPEGFQSGGGVVLNDLRVEPAGEGRWTVSGEIVNRTSGEVLNVRVKLETAPVGEDPPWRAEVAVASTLGPDGTGAFTHTFASEASSRPAVRANIIWMAKETKTEVDYNRNAPHPSAVRLDHGGGVGSVDVRPTPVG